LCSLKDLCQTIKPYLNENNNLFINFGPNSGANSKGPVRWDLTLWYKSRREIILPNNKIILELLDVNKDLIPTEHTKTVTKFKNHVFAFEKHCEDSLFDYSQHIFPQEFPQLIANGIKEN